MCAASRGRCVVRSRSGFFLIEHGIDNSESSCRVTGSSRVAVHARTRKYATRPSKTLLLHHRLLYLRLRRRSPAVPSRILLMTFGTPTDILDGIASSQFAILRAHCCSFQNIFRVCGGSSHIFFSRAPPPRPATSPLPLRLLRRIR